MQSTKQRKAGFTLVELMIVIAVIGILAAALVPNLLGARAQAQNVELQTCARSIQTAQEIVRAETGEYAQVATGPDDRVLTASSTATNTKITASSLDDTGLLSCPEGIAIEDGSASASSESYTFVLQHTDLGNRNYQVTQTGITAQTRP